MINHPTYIPTQKLFLNFYGTNNRFSIYPSSLFQNALLRMSIKVLESFLIHTLHFEESESSCSRTDIFTSYEPAHPIIKRIFKNIFPVNQPILNFLHIVNGIIFSFPTNSLNIFPNYGSSFQNGRSHILKCTYLQFFK